MPLREDIISDIRRRGFGIVGDRIVTYISEVPTQADLDALESAEIDHQSQSSQLFAWTVQQKRGGRFIPVGDSLTGSTNGGTATWQQRGMNWPNLLTSILGPSVRQVRNAGVAGNKASDVLARLQADVLDYRPDIVHLQIGANDAGNSVPLAIYKSNMQAIADLVRASGARLIVGNVLAREATYRTQVAQYNAWLANWTAIENIDLIDYYAYSVDYATGGIRAGIATDSLHPDAGASQRLIAEFAATALSGILGLRPFYRSMYATSEDGTTTADAENLLKGGCFNLDTNADGVVDFFTTSGGAALGTFTVEEDDVYIFGKNQQEVRTTKTGNGVWTGTSITTGFSVGDILAFSGMVRLAGFEAGLAPIYFRLSTQANAHMSPITGWTYDTDGLTATGGWIPFYCEGKVPTGATSLSVSRQVSGTGTSGTSQWAMLTVQNLTTQETALWI